MSAVSPYKRDRGIKWETGEVSKEFAKKCDVEPEAVAHLSSLIEDALNELDQADPFPDVDGG